MKRVCTVHVSVLWFCFLFWINFLQFCSGMNCVRGIWGYISCSEDVSLSSSPVTCIWLAACALHTTGRCELSGAAVHKDHITEGRGWIRSHARSLQTVEITYHPSQVKPSDPWSETMQVAPTERPNAISCHRSRDLLSHQYLYINPLSPHLNHSFLVLSTTQPQHTNQRWLPSFYPRNTPLSLWSTVLSRSSTPARPWSRLQFDQLLVTDPTVLQSLPPLSPPTPSVLWNSSWFS